MIVGVNIMHIAIYLEVSYGLQAERTGNHQQADRRPISESCVDAVGLIALSLLPPSGV